MGFVLAMAQCRYPDDGDVLADVRRWVGRAQQAGAQLLVFPEALMTRFNGSLDQWKAAAEPADGPFASAIDAMAAQAGMWVAYTMNERNPNGLPFNTLVITDSAGDQCARYRKVHLFDAQGECESSRMAAGDCLMPPVRAPFATVGAGICYDLRFPELARTAALDGAHVMLYPAAWVEGPGKQMQWETLLRARAIENGMFVAGVGSCNPGRIGCSCVFGPDGALVAQAGADEELLVCEIDLAEVSRVRTVTPSLQHRRPELFTCDKIHAK